MDKRILPTVLGALLLLSSAPVYCEAATITFFGEDNIWQGRTNADAANADFMIHLSAGVETQNFEGFADGTGAPLDLNFGVAGVATLSGTGFVENVGSDGVGPDGRWATSGDQYWEAQSANFTINFIKDDIAAFGFYGTDIGDIQGQLTLNVTFSDGLSQIFNVGNTIGAVDGSGLFWGMISDNRFIQSITFGTTASADYFGFDDMTIGTVKQLDTVPEPATLLLLGAGLFGLAGIRKKK